jgi:endoglucanase
MRFNRSSLKASLWNVVGIFVLLSAVLCSITAAAINKQIADPVALHVRGTHIVDGAGNSVTLIGASRYGLEFDCHGDGHYTLADFQAMRSWGMNAVRLTLSSAYWLNLQNVCPDYRATVADAIANAEQAHLYVMLVLQREAPFPIPDEIEHGGVQYQMPDINAIPFWRDLAQHYAHDPRVIFELFSEPHDVSWQIWRDGGTVDTDHGTYQTPGMQALVKLINDIAPGHLVVAGGLVYAYDLSGITSGYALTGSNIVYATHPYDYDNKQQADWRRAFLNLSLRAPVIATEFGEFDGGSHYVRQVIAQFTALGTGYFAWAWTAGTGNTDLLAPGRWDGTPSAYGSYIRDAMRHHGIE